MALDEERVEVFVDGEYDDPTYHLLHDGEGMCFIARRGHGPPRPRLPDEEIVSATAYADRLGQQTLVGTDEKPPEICGHCWTTARSEAEDDTERPDYDLISAPDHGTAYPYAVSEQLTESSGHRSGVPQRLGDRADLANITGSRWRFKWSGDPRNVHCDLLTAHDASFYEMMVALTSAIRMPTNLHPWGFYDRERHLDARFEIIAPRIFDEGDRRSATIQNAETYPVGDALEAMELHQYDRIYFVCDFGTPTTAYGILKEPIITALDERVEEIDPERTTHGTVMWKSGEERPPRY